MDKVYVVWRYELDGKVVVNSGVWDIYSTREKAIAGISAEFEGLVYHENMSYWSFGDRYEFFIMEHPLADDRYI